MLYIYIYLLIYVSLLKLNVLHWPAGSTSETVKPLTVKYIKINSKDPHIPNISYLKDMTKITKAIRGLTDWPPKCLILQLHEVGMKKKSVTVITNQKTIIQLQIIWKCDKGIKTLSTISHIHTKQNIKHANKSNTY